MRTAWEISREMFLSEQEVHVLLGHVRRDLAALPPADGRAAQLDRLIVETLLFTGLRNSEFCRLRHGDLDRDASGARLTIRQGDPTRQGEAIDREVYVPSPLARLIAEYCETTRNCLLPADADPADPLQPLVFHERRRPFERTGLYRRVVRILSEAGLGDRASVQLLRHTYGYLAYLRTGGNLLFTQRQLGHAHPIVTSIYAQFVPESYSRLAEMLAMEPPTEPTDAKRSPGKRLTRKTSPSTSPPGAST
ncbi:MAG TPA: site-specific integrase [Pirellulales bacterium]|nr:site-specific integrase [Pirellulales bacterium]